MLKKVINKAKYIFLVQVKRLLCCFDGNLISVFAYPPGHFYSPLLNISEAIKQDSIKYWENIKINKNKIKNFYKVLKKQKRHFKRFHANHMFPTTDAVLLHAILHQKKPKRVIEVGCGFSTLAFLDAFEVGQAKTRLTCIEPFPERLLKNISLKDLSKISLIKKPLQEVSMQQFKRLKKNDVLFIDSSHVAKVGSDVSYLFLQVLSNLRRGVLVHFHDIVYPVSYPRHWIKEGVAWNESLFLRAFLVESSKYEIVAFNSYFYFHFPKIGQKVFSTEEIQQGGTGGSIWLVKK